MNVQIVDRTRYDVAYYIFTMILDMWYVVAIETKLKMYVKLQVITSFAPDYHVKLENFGNIFSAQITESTVYANSIFRGCCPMVLW